MTFYKQVGNIRIFTKHYEDNSIEISFFNGSDLIARETYFNSTDEAAINDLLSKTLDIHTESFVYSVFLERYSNNTFATSPTNWFCRIDNTKYFQHFHKSAENFITDKDGLKIIDR